ncbi:hypothetical protein BOVATA_042680 [Babesia ovata]|uniref:Uncharacterized protein n=1 Tax=Babesia ovata TaxID=189622 RepID=A0A2H6KIG2_9APIC|nr:uncharacterized protein BOVATA_042680 [Babesia ovata]GBE62775.1 hypothetical protein BOVATA_042680 [Babesia ovata]
MCALTSTVRQVGNELKSVLLDNRVGNYGKGSKSIAQELDKVVGETKKLHQHLEAAEKQTNDQQRSTYGDPNNEILKKVNEIEQQVKMAMKQKGNDIEVEETMTSYKEKREKPANDKDGLYKKLTEQDIPQAMEPFKQMGGFSQEQSELKAGKVEKAKNAVQEHLSKITRTPRDRRDG